MAEEKTPLLTADVSDEYHVSRQQIRNIFKNNLCSDATERAINVSGSGSPSPSAAELDHIVCVFVVAFDTRSGNMVEWCIPEDMELDGVEFKAMASGSHTLNRDFVYFRKDNLYGLACFENMPVESEIERGARMKSVGILSTSYTLLYRHMQFLETQVRHQLEIPGKYTQLKAFYEDKKGILSLLGGSANNHQSPASTPSTPMGDILVEMKITHPAGCFSQFIKFFGVHIFLLWKFALLQRRILFFSPPPIGVVCYRVYCACCLANHDIDTLRHELKPHFYINVADIEILETEMAYVACTTEKIFESKTKLYDIYVDNQVVKTSSPASKDILKVSDADRDKYAKLNNQRSAFQFSLEEYDEDMNEEEIFTNFFVEQNNRLFQTLLDVSASQDRQLTSEHIRSMGLDPIGDRPFLMELVEHYGIDVVLMVDNPCCPK